MTEKIAFIATGGTLEKTYNTAAGVLGFWEKRITDLLKITRHTLSVEVQQPLQIDSLEMNDTDRAKVFEACVASEKNRIVITHGTDRMPETASFLNKRIKNKTIVLTGAMVPYSVEKSDALFNIGTAMAFVQTLPKGVYIAMNGKIFEANKVAKNKKKGIFISI